MIEVCSIVSYVLYTQILKQSVLKPASPGITLSDVFDFTDFVPTSGVIGDPQYGHPSD